MLTEIIDNEINKRYFENQQEYLHFIEKLQEEFYSIEEFEHHFKMDTPPEDSEEFDNGEVNIETTKHKPDRYPCLYVFYPDGSDGWTDDFIYLGDY